MMRLFKNSEPVFHTHECADSDKGRVMTSEEFRDFMVECLMEEYRETGATVTRLERKGENQADFSFTSMDKVINVAVRCNALRSDDIPDFDPSWMQEEYHKTGKIPRLAIVRAWCVAGDNYDGEPAVCGGEFCLLTRSISLIPGEMNKDMDKHLSDIELADKFARAWKEFDASIIEPYLDKDFHYGSAWVFDELPSRYEYIDYFKGKLVSIANGNDYPVVKILRNKKEHKCALSLAQKKMTNYLMLETYDGRIISARMVGNADGYEETDLSDDLYQGHGDHLSAIVDSESLMGQRFQDIISNAKMFKTARTKFTDEDIDNENVTIYSLKNGEGDMSMLCELAFIFRKQENRFVSLFPMMKGDDVEVTIERIHEWDNQAEATIDCSASEFEFSFFAVDYYANKAVYKVGEKITVSLAALAMKAELSPKSFSFEGQQAIDWLAKIGEEPEYDENGSVKPVVFGLEKLVAYMNHDHRAPDEAEFQSPISGLEELSVLDVDFWKTRIAVHKSIDDESEVRVPMYFRKDMITDVKEGDAVRGWLWMTGYIAGANEKDDLDTKGFNAANFCEDFESFLNHLDSKKGFDDIEFITRQLPKLTIKDGYVLDAYKTWVDGAPEFRIYCCIKDSQIRYLPVGVSQDEVGTYLDNEIVRGNVQCEFPEFNDEWFIHESIPYSATLSVPDAIGYYKVPFTEDGIIQAWLLHMLPELLTQKYLHIQDRVYYFSRDLAEKELKGLDIESFLPHISIDGDRAEITYAFSRGTIDCNEGLVIATTVATRNGDGITFSDPSYEEFEL